MAQRQCADPLGSGSPTSQARGDTETGKSAAQFEIHIVVDPEIRVAATLCGAIGRAGSPDTASLLLDRWCWRCWNEWAARKTCMAWLRDPC